VYSIAQLPEGLGSVDWHAASDRTIVKGNQWQETYARRVRIEQLDAYLAELARLRVSVAWDSVRQFAVWIDAHFHDEIQTLPR